VGDSPFVFDDNTEGLLQEASAATNGKEIMLKLVSEGIGSIFMFDMKTG